MNLLAQLLSLQDATSSRDEYVRGAFGYPGAKSRSIKELLPILPYRNVWVDVFGGSGVVTLARNPSNLEVFNDRCSGVVAFFRAIREPEKCKKLIERLEESVYAREEFIWCRDTWECDWLDDVERAARWYYCVQASFASKGWAFGRTTSGKNQSKKLYNNLECFWPISNRFRNIVVENQDWRQVLDDFNNDSNGHNIVWYLDPTYWRVTNVFNHELTERDHYELAERCMHLEGFVAVSGYDHPDHPYNKYKWSDKKTWEVPITMTGLAFHESNHLAEYKDQMIRGKAVECLWIRDTMT